MEPLAPATRPRRRRDQPRGRHPADSVPCRTRPAVIALRGFHGLLDHGIGDPLTSPGAWATTRRRPALLQVPFRRLWPDYDAASGEGRRETRAWAAAPHWDADERVLTVVLPKGEPATVRESPTATRRTSTSTACGTGSTAATPRPLRSQAAAGAHWMISPPREMVLVHAVQHPLEPAHFTAPSRPNATRSVRPRADSTGRSSCMCRAPADRRDRQLDGVARRPDNGVVEDQRESVACDLTVQVDWSGALTSRRRGRRAGPPRVRRHPPPPGQVPRAARRRASASTCARTWRSTSQPRERRR